MMRSLGKVVVVLFALASFTSIALWALTNNIKPVAIKRFIEQQIGAITHEASHIHGDVSWQLLPRPSLKVAAVEIGTDDDDYHATIESLAFNLKITQLMKGSFLFNELAIDKLSLKLNPQKTITENKHESKDYLTSDKHTEFAIKKVSVMRSQIIIGDEQEQTKFKNMQVVLEDFNLNKESLPIQIKARFNKNDALTQIKANLSFTGRINRKAPNINGFKGLFTHMPDIEGQLVLQDNHYNQVVIDEINTTVKTHKEHIEFNPLTASLYDGEAVGTMSYKLDTHQISLNQTATNLDGKRLLSALLGYKMISGLLDYSIHASFVTDKPMLASFTGNGQVTLKEGRLYSLNLDEPLDHLKEQLTQFVDGHKDVNFLKDLNTAQLTKGGMPFNLASIEYQLTNEQLSSQEIIVQTNKLHIQGTGLINLKNHQINSKLQVNSTDNDLVMENIQSIIGGYFPLAISGTIEQPYVSPDFKSIKPILTQLLINPALQGLMP